MPHENPRAIEDAAHVADAREALAAISLTPQAPPSPCEGYGGVDRILSIG